MDTPSEPRRVDALLFEGMNLLDLSGPVQAFDAAGTEALPAYRVRYVSVDGKPVRASCGLRLVPDARLDVASRADDLLIPGGTGVDRHVDDAHLAAVIARWRERRADGRLVSVCSGALLLAAAGVLDGEEATTHWSRRAEVETRFTRVRWNLDRIYVLGDSICTSAGVTTGIDLALAIIARDRGAAAALAAAQELVVYLKRPGGQSQFSSLLPGQFRLAPGLGRLVDAVTAAPGRNWTLELMADEVAMNSRTLSRRFAEAMKMSPVRFVERVRLDLARQFLASGMPLARAASASGFGDTQRMRRSFLRRVGISPEQYVARFGEPSA